SCGSLLAGGMLVVLVAVSCDRSENRPRSTASATTAGPVAVEVVRVIEQPLDVQLSLPGELTAYQSVAIVPKVTGFVKRVMVDRGSSVHAGDLVRTLESHDVF